MVLARPSGGVETGVGHESKGDAVCPQPANMRSQDHQNWDQPARASGGGDTPSALTTETDIRAMANTTRSADADGGVDGWVELKDRDANFRIRVE